MALVASAGSPREENPLDLDLTSSVRKFVPSKYCLHIILTLQILFQASKSRETVFAGDTGASMVC